MAGSSGLVIRRALFVCTGNIFRSLTADVALRALLAQRQDIHVSSAGTDDHPHVVGPYTRGYLLSKGFDVSSHRRRTLTRATHVRKTIDRIVELAPRMAVNIEVLLQKYGGIR